MRNVKCSTFYILAACFAVVLLCCCVGGVYFACRREGGRVVKAEALNNDLVQVFYDSKIEYILSTSDFVSFKGEVTADGFIISPDSGAPSWAHDSFNLTVLNNYIFQSVQSKNPSLTYDDFVYLQLTFNNPDGFSFTSTDVFGVWQNPKSSTNLDLPSRKFLVDFVYGDKSLIGGTVDGQTVDGKLVSFFMYPPVTVPQTYDEIRISFVDYKAFFPSAEIDESIYMALPGSFEPDIVKLDTPTLSVSNNVLSWHAIDHATRYNIYQDGQYYNWTNKTSYTVTDTSVQHTYQVAAVGNNANYVTSELSNAVLVGTAPVKHNTPVLSYADGELFWTADRNSTAIYRSTSADGPFDYVTEVAAYKYTITEGGYYWRVVTLSIHPTYLDSDPSNVVFVSESDLPDPEPDPDPDPDPDPGPTPPVSDDLTPPEIFNTGTTWLAHGRWSDTSGGLHDFTFYGNASNFKSFLTADDYGVSMQLVYEYLESQLVSETNYESIDTCTFSIYFGVNFTYTPVSYSFLYTGSVDGVTVQLSPVPSASTSAIVLDLMDDDSYREPYMVIPSYFNGALVDIISFKFRAAYNSMSGTFLLFDYFSNIIFDYGYDLGHDEGYSSGLSDGYNNGFNAGLNDSGFMSLMTAVVDAPIKAFMGLFDIDIMGFNIAGVLIAILSIALVSKVIALLM